MVNSISHCKVFSGRSKYYLKAWLIAVVAVSMCSLYPVSVSAQECEPRDCIVSQWMEWSTCSASCGDSGTRTRSRTILQEASCGGTCGDETSQSEECNRQCCPKNCVFSEWTGWSSCQCYSNRCPGHGKWYVCYRFRKKLSEEACGGYCDQRTFDQLCQRPCCYKDCILGGWEPWGKCEARCESPGLATRIRTRIQEPDCGGKRCVEDEEQRACQGPCCPEDCVLGLWSEWSACPAVCGQANITRSRFITEPICRGAACNETETTQTKTCEVYSNVDCKMSPWSEWSQCVLDNGRCGRGSKSRSRRVITEPECRGEPCPNATETSVCFGECCRTDCQVGDWSEYGHCSTNCGTGFATRTRQITVDPTCGGTECPTLSENRDCMVSDVTDCAFTDWSEWSDCSNDCGEGKVTRSRTQLTPAYCGGQCADESTEEEMTCESFSARRDCVVSEWSPWAECVRDCDTGSQTSSRTILEIDQCGGIPCEGTCNLTRIRPCHEKCSQQCNQGVCTCDTGYRLQADGHTCLKVDCGGSPRLSYCAPGTVPFDSCRVVNFKCKATLYGDRCNGSCSNNWVIKGSPRYVECLASGKWSQPKMFCGPTNMPPIDLDISTTRVSELTRKDACIARLTTETTNEDWDVHSYSIQDDPSDTLAVKGDKVCIKTHLDYETSLYREWNVTIRSTDLDGLTLDKVFTFFLENENDPPRSATLFPDSVPENSPYGTAIGCFTVREDDEGQTVTVNLLSREDLFTLYQVDNGSYCLKVNAESDPDCPMYGGKLCRINFEEQARHFIAVMVADDAPTPGESYFEVSIDVTDVNEPVTGLTFDPQNALENVEAGKRLLQLEAEDEDQDTVHEFEIISDPSGLFSIEGDSLLASEELDFERNPQREFTLKVKVTDPVAPVSSVEESITFGIEDVNEHPYNLILTSDNSLETYPLNKPVAKENIENVNIGTVSVIEPDKGDNVDFSVNDTRFSIGKKRCTSNQQGAYHYCLGQLVYNGAFDFEKEPMVYILITAEDKARHSIEQEIQIEVINTDDPPTDILIDGNTTDTIRVPENSQGLQIASLQAVDEDQGDSHTFFLSGGASRFFAVKGNFLQTRPKVALDFESYSPLTLMITAIDGGDASITRNFNIDVTDVNEPPTTIHFSADTVVENSEAGTVVSEMTARDPDNVNGGQQTFSFQLLDDSKGRFGVQDNKLVVKLSDQICGSSLCALDYEGQRDLLVEVKVTDDGVPPRSRVESKLISVLNANDAPHNLRISSSYVRENKIPGSVIGVLTATDQDEGDTLTFTLRNHTEEFEIIQGNQLVQIDSLDFEGQNEYLVEVQVEDSGSPTGTLTAAVQIQVTDANEPPAFVGPDDYTILENATVQSVVTLLSVLDPDGRETVTWGLDSFDDVFMIGEATTEEPDSGGTLVKAELRTQALLNFERLDVYDIMITMRDSKGLETRHEIQLRILDTNDPPQDILLDGSPSPEISVEEGTTSDVGDLTVVDEDSHQSHTFAITAQPGNHFAVTGNKLQVSSPLDAETTSTVDITVEVTDSGTPPASFRKNLTIVVNNVNEPPSSLTLLNTQIAENSVDGTEVGLLLPEDPDSQTGFDFDVLDDADGRFKVDGYKILVSSSSQCTEEDQRSCSLNFEEHQSHTIKVMVTDHDFPPQRATFDLQIDVTDANDSPFDIRLSSSTVEELAPAETVIGRLSVADEDPGQTHTVTLEDNPGQLFKIGDDGVSLVKATGDRLRTSQVYSVTVVATDDGQPAKSTEKSLFLSVTGVSEVPKDIKLTSARQAIVQVDDANLVIPENSPVGVVATISGQDNDLEHSIAFSLLEDAGGVFALADDTSCSVQSETETVVCSVSLELREELDFELKHMAYSITVLATDTEGGTASQTFHLEVDNVAEAPTDITFSTDHLDVYENSRAVVVGRFASVDQDADDTHTFTLTEDGSGAMDVTPTGTLSVGSEANIDYEQTASFNITIEVTDSTGNAFTKSFPVAVINVNEKPTGVSISQNTISEGSAPNSVIGQLSTVDPDNEDLHGNPQQTFQYLLRDDADGRFYLDDSSLLVSTKGAQCTESWCGLNFEANPEHEIQVQVTDSGTPAISALFSVKVLVSDGNDAPILLDVDVSQLKEDLETGSEVALLSATDEDNGQVLSYSIVDNEEGPFSIEGNKLILSEGLDFEARESVSVTISVTDDGTPAKSTRKTYDLAIINVDEEPSSIHFESVRGSQTEMFPSDQPMIRENLAVETLIGQLVVMDPDRNEDITIIISGDLIVAEDPGCLTLTRGTRCVSSIVLGKTLDYESLESFSVSVSAIDLAGKKLMKDFQISVKDQNDAPQKILINEKDTNVIEVQENMVNLAIGKISVIDEDANQTFTIEVKGSSQFYIIADELWIGSAAQLDFERTQEINLRVKATDSGVPSLSLEKEIVIKILDVNEAPLKTTLTRNQVSEDSVAGVNIGNFVTIDPDNQIELRQTFQYELIEDEDGLFMIEDGDLKVQKAGFDYEEKTQHNIKVRVSDSGEPPLSSEFDFEIVVMDRNDAPSNIQLIGDSVKESAPSGTLIGRLSADDPDEGQSVSFTIQNSDHVIVSNNTVVVSDNLDFETEPTFDFEVIASDDALPAKYISRTFTVSVTDVNEAPSRLTFTSMSESGKLEIDERTQANELIGTIQSYDVDRVDGVEFSVSERSSKSFKLDVSEANCTYQFVASMGSSYTVCATKVFLVEQVHFRPLQPSLLLEVTATDKGELTLKSKWDIAILNVNDAPYNITIKNDRHEVPENLGYFLLGALECVDRDVGQSHIFQVLSHWDVFKVSQDSMLSVTKPLNAEEQAQYELTLRCIDSGKPEESYQKTFLIDVKDVNEAPTEITLSHDQVPMTAKDGDTVALISVTDPDNEGANSNKQQHSCVITKDASQSFQIGLKDETQALQVKGSVPIHNESVTITIECSDDGSPPLNLTKIFKILVTEDANVPKEIILKGSGEITENSENVEIGTFAIRNQLTGNEIQGTFIFENLTVSETDADVLSIRGDKLYVNIGIDFEALPSLSGTVQAAGQDTKGNAVKVDGAFELAVLDVNESPTEILIYGGGFVKENQPEGTVIGKLNTLDPEPYQEYTYEVVSVTFGLDVGQADPALLEVIALDGVTLRTGPKHRLLDFEVAPTLSLVIQTTDSGSPALSLNYTVRIVVVDANDAPTNISLDSYTVTENAPLKTLVGRLQVADADSQQSHLCVVNNLQHVPFNVENSLDLVVSKEELDYEAQRTFVVDLTCEDKGEDGSHLKITKALTVRLVDENEPPYNISLSRLDIEEENSVGDLVATISATDPDSREIFFTVEEDNSNFFIQGTNSLVAGVVFDFEKQSSYSVTVKARDDGGLSSTQQFMIQIVDKNEKPSSISLTNDVVTENAERGFLVAHIRTADPDLKQSFNYTLTDLSSSSGQFVIIGDRLEVGDGTLDFETSDSHRISVTSQDDGQPAQMLTVEFDITVRDVNEAPSAIDINEPLIVDENTQPQTVLTEITVQDEERDQPHFCSIINPQVPFSITTSSNGVIQLIGSDLIDFEDKPSYDLNISCSDGEFNIYKMLRVEVTNLNEAPTGIILKGPQALPAAVAGDYEVGTLIAEDEDEGQDHIFTVTGSNSDIFKITDGNRLILKENIPKDILALPSPKLNLTLTVIDSGLSFRQVLTLPISDEDLQRLKLPEIISSTREIMEDAERGDVVAQISEQVNQSLAEHITFSVLDDPNSLFSMSDNDLVLTKDISHVTVNSVNVGIQALSKVTQEVQEATLTYYIVRSDKCYDNGQTCDEDARCVKVNDTTHSCQCKDDFQGNGYSCQQVDDCVGNNSKCGAHGECVDDVNSYKCKCESDFSGPACEIGPPTEDACTDNECQNLAVCSVRDEGEGYDCNCPPGWAGRFCEVSVDDCREEEDTCSADGLCVDEHLSFSCNCSAVRFGHRCQYLKAACDAVTCQGTEVCIPTQNELDGSCCPANTSVSLDVLCEEMDTSEQCVNRFLHFAERNGIFLVDNVPQNSFNVFPSSKTDVRNGAVSVTFFVLADSHFPLTEGQVLENLAKTCEAIDSSNLSESLHCPMIMEAFQAFKDQTATQRPPPTTRGGTDPGVTPDPNPGGNTASSIQGNRLLFVQLVMVVATILFVFQAKL